MIAMIRGSILEVGPGFVVVDVGGIGFHVHVPVLTGDQAGRVGDTVNLRTHLEVREDALELFGFFDSDQREVFRALVSVPRVGGRLAMRILAHLTPVQVVQAVELKDLPAFKGIAGVGESLAERIVLDLARKTRKLSLSGKGVARGVSPEMTHKAQDALKALGYRPEEIRDAISYALGRAREGAALDEVVRLALSYFQRGSE